MEVIIFGSDKYLRALMPTFTTFYRRFWPDNPWPTRVVSQTVIVDEFPTITTGPDENFSQQVLRWAVKQRDEPFLMLLDDYFLTEPVKTDVLVHCYNEMIAHPDIAHINVKVIGSAPWNQRYDDYLGEFDKEECNWLFQNQAGLWRPQLLRSVTRADEDGWRMERDGSQRAKTYPGRFLTVYEDAIEYVNYMARAAPRKEGVEWLERNGMDPIYP